MGNTLDGRREGKGKEREGLPRDLDSSGKGVSSARPLSSHPVPMTTEEFIERTVPGAQRGAQQINPDYSCPEAAYSLRVDPITSKGPMHIDARDFTYATSYTAEGAKRNKNQFWQLWSARYPETLSAENMARISRKNKPIAPKVDDTWLKYFPEHHKFKDEILIHHHIEHGIPVTALPESLHARNPGRQMFHSNLGGIKKND